MSPLVLCLIGSMTGLHAATWGAFKDSPFEGFRPASFVRSLVLGVVVALLAGRAGLLGSGTAPLVGIGVCYAGERLVTEWWKAILREDRQSAYTIPMRLALHGRTVDARLPRYAAGACIAAGLAGAFTVARVLEPRVAGAPWWVAVAVGGIGGWLTAVGGAWKDAPVEGFELAKFFRSPWVATAWAGVLVPTCSSPAVLVLAAGGLSVASIETYKTFLAGGPPGKFAGKRTPFEVAALRGLCRRAHGATYVALVLVLALGLHLGGVGGGPGGLARDAGALAPLVWASCWATLVLGRANWTTVELSRGVRPSPGSPGRLSDADVRGASS
jgi:hypothetical protein